MTMVRTLARHLVAAIMAFVAGWLTPLLLGLGYTEGQVASTMTGLSETLVMFIMLVAYFTTEKLLKPLFYRRVGERQMENTAVNRTPRL